MNAGGMSRGDARARSNKGMKQTKPSILELRSLSPVFGRLRGRLMIARLSGTRALVLMAVSASGGIMPVSAVDAVLDANRKVETRGVPVLVSVTPGCRLAGDDADGNARAEAFKVQVHKSLVAPLADVEFPEDFSSWAAEIEVTSEGLPPTGRPGGVRITKSAPSLDVTLMRAIYRSSLPALPNFRAKCTFEVGVRRWRAPEPE
jgi:hypothetical protein